MAKCCFTVLAHVRVKQRLILKSDLKFFAHLTLNVSLNLKIIQGNIKEHMWSLHKAVFI
jgi:hypothetical protein